LPIELAHEARAVFNVLKNKMILGTDDCLTGVVAIMSVQVLCCEGVSIYLPLKIIVLYEKHYLVVENTETTGNVVVKIIF
jgi:hypothetical protein